MTGDWQRWETAAVDIPLTAGARTIRLQCAAPGFQPELDPLQPAEGRVRRQADS